MSSVAEQILARVQQALITASIAGGRIDRGREDAYGEDECPAVNIKRSGTETNTHATGLEHSLLTFDLELHIADSAWETASDALHMLTHAALLSDAPLASLGRGLRCTGTETLGDSADFTTGKLVAHYQIQFITRPGDLTRAIT